MRTRIIACLFAAALALPVSGQAADDLSNESLENVCSRLKQRAPQTDEEKMWAQECATFEEAEKAMKALENLGAKMQSAFDAMKEADDALQQQMKKAIEDLRKKLEKPKDNIPSSPNQLQNKR